MKKNPCPNAAGAKSNAADVTAIANARFILFPPYFRDRFSRSGESLFGLATKSSSARRRVPHQVVSSDAKPLGNGFQGGLHAEEHLERARAAESMRLSFHRPVERNPRLAHRTAEVHKSPV